MILILVDQSGPDQTTVDQGTRGPGDQGTRGPGDQRWLRSLRKGDQGTRGPGDQGTGTRDG